jgi:multidrug efflux pump
MIRRGMIALLLFGGMVLIAAGLWRITPGSLVPDEDQGFYIAAVILPDGASLQRTDKVVNEVVEILKSNPANEDVVAFTGFDFLGGGFRNNAATIFVTQKHWDERKVTTPQLVGEFFMKTGHIKEGLVLAFAPPAIFGLGTAGGYELYVQNRGDRAAEKQQEVQAAVPRPAELRPDARRRADAVARQRAAALRRRRPRQGQGARRPGRRRVRTLSSTLGSFYVNDFNKYGRTWQVLMSAEPQYRNRPDDGRQHVGALGQRRDGAAVVAGERAPHLRRRLARPLQQPAGGEDLRPGGAGRQFRAGDRARRADRARGAAARLQLDWSGASFQEKKSGGTSGLALGMAVVMVFLILAAQYEKWSLPFSVLMALPFGTFGALAAVWLRGLTNDVYFQIGLVTLLGLAAKNAILIVEYASLKRERGLLDGGGGDRGGAAALPPDRDDFAGVHPRRGAAGVFQRRRRRRARFGGTGVMGGMLAATFLAIFFVPFFFKLILQADRG